MEKVYFYKTDCTNPYINLATEKYFMDVSEPDSITLFLWQNHDTVVIGANQNPWSECRCELMKKDGITLARRRSGGGAVFHDLGNVNFSFIAPKDCYDLERNMQVIVLTCKMAGIDACVTGRNDITADGKKFSGNAFLTKNGVCLHHGTLLVNSDFAKLSNYLSPPMAKLESKGIKSVRSRVVNLCEFSKDITTEKLMDYLKIAFEKVYAKSEQITQIDFEKIQTDANAFSDFDYLYGKTFEFTLTQSDKLSFGNVEIKLLVKDGAISFAKMFTDSLDITISDKVQSALENCKMDKQKVLLALEKTVEKNTANEISELIFK